MRGVEYDGFVISVPFLAFLKTFNHVLYLHLETVFLHFFIKSHPDIQRLHSVKEQASFYIGYLVIPSI